MAKRKKKKKSAKAAEHPLLSDSDSAAKSGSRSGSNDDDTGDAGRARYSSSFATAASPDIVAHCKAIFEWLDPSGSGVADFTALELRREVHLVVLGLRLARGLPEALRHSGVLSLHSRPHVFLRRA
eukprot:SAG11_NODE_15123_length_588_cov_1.167689_1_plen_125_part_01